MRVLSLRVLLAGLLLIPVGALPADPPAATPAPRVTLRLSDADLVETLYLLFQDTGLRYEAPGGIAARFSCDFEDVPLDTALRLLLQPRGLALTREGDTYHISPSEGFVPVSQQLAKERDERLRRYRIVLSRRPPRPLPRSGVVYRPGVANIQIQTFIPSPGGVYLAGPGMSEPMPLYAYPVTMPALEQPIAVTRPAPSSSLRLGPLTIPIPEGFRLLPSGGWELGVPAEHEVIVNGVRVPTPARSGGGGLSIRQR